MLHERSRYITNSQTTLSRWTFIFTLHPGLIEALFKAIKLQCLMGWDSWLYLDLLQLLLVGGVHLLQPLLQLPVSLQETLPELGCQLQVCRRDRMKNHRCFSAHSLASLMDTWALCKQLCKVLGLLAEIHFWRFVPHGGLSTFISRVFFK